MAKKKINKKKVIFWSLFGLGVVSITGISGIELYKYLRNKEGSWLWYKKATLEQLEKYLDKITERYANSGLNNVSDEEFNFLWNEKNKLNNLISEIKNINYIRENPNIQIRHREHGYYLPNDG